MQPNGAHHNQDHQYQHTETHHPSTSRLDAEVNAAQYNPGSLLSLTQPGAECSISSAKHLGVDSVDVSQHTQREPRLVGGVFVCFQSATEGPALVAPWSRDAVNRARA